MRLAHQMGTITFLAEKFLLQARVPLSSDMSVSPYTEAWTGASATAPKVSGLLRGCSGRSPAPIIQGSSGDDSSPCRRRHISTSSRRSRSWSGETLLRVIAIGSVDPVGLWDSLDYRRTGRLARRGRIL